MIITCPKCDSRFVAADHLIGEGRNVRCAKCEHKWFQEKGPLDEAVNEKAANKNLDGSDPKEAKSDNKKATNIMSKNKKSKKNNDNNKKEERKFIILSSIKLATIFIVVILTSIILNADNNFKESSYTSLLSTLGIDDTSGVVVYNVSATKERNGNFYDIIVKGILINESDSIKQLPKVRVNIFNEQLINIRSKELSHDGIIEPGEEISFENIIPRLPKNTAKIVVDLGNTIELSKR